MMNSFSPKSASVKNVLIEELCSTLFLVQKRLAVACQQNIFNAFCCGKSYIILFEEYGFVFSH